MDSQRQECVDAAMQKGDVTEILWLYLQDDPTMQDNVREIWLKFHRYPDECKEVMEQIFYHVPWKNDVALDEALIAFARSRIDWPQLAHRLGCEP